MSTADLPALVAALEAVVGAAHVRTATRIAADDTHDESLTATPVVPLAVVRPATTGEVSRLLQVAHGAGVSVVARGSGTGLSGGALPAADGIVVCFDRMDRILEIDTENHVVVAQPGVTLAALDEALRPHGLVYAVYPGEMSASLGGSVATNAGGMRAVRYGVTRHHVLGLEVVLADGTVVRTGGRYVKSSTGYDLTQLVVGSEGTLALVTEVTAKVVPRLTHTATLLAPFPSLEAIARAVPPIVASGVAPLILEYVDALTMAGITGAAQLDLGVPESVRSEAAAYLVVVLESAGAARLDEDAETGAKVVAGTGALDVYVLPPTAGAALIAARERAFFVGKAAGAHDVVDTVVPRAEIPGFLAMTARLAAAHGAVIAGCGHVGDGNVHLSVFQPDAEARHALLRGVFAAAKACGGAVSGEHGIGTEKRPYFLELEQPEKLSLMARIKAAFDPAGILGPGRLVDAGPPDPQGSAADDGPARGAPAAAERTLP